MKKRAELHQVSGAKESIGAKLKAKRQEIGYSFGDMSDMTGFSKSTISNLENGIATNIDYYITLSQALKLELPTLFDISIDLKPRYELPANKLGRVFLSRKIRKLLEDENFFDSEQSVDSVLKRLEAKYEVAKSKEVSTNISRILLNLVEEGYIAVVAKNGRNNIYKIR